MVIKYRVYDPERNVIEDVRALDWYEGTENPLTCHTPTAKLYGYYHPIFDFVLLPFTGLQDKYGNDIYKGDIVKFTVPPTYFSLGDILLRGFVDFDNASFMINTGVATYYRWLDYDDIEVIGNIYTDKHLLEGD